MASNCTYCDEEVQTFLDQVVETQSFSKIDGKTQTNIKIFMMLASRVNAVKIELGREWDEKSGTQWRTKWKSLKKKYLSEKTSSSKSGAAPSTWKWFEKMREVMGHRPIANEVDAAMNQIDQQALEEDDTTERPSSVASTSSSTSLSRKRKHGYNSRSEELEQLRAELEKQRKEDVATISKIMEDSNKAMLNGLSQIIGQVMSSQPNLPPPQPYQYQYNPNHYMPQTSQMFQTPQNPQSPIAQTTTSSGPTPQELTSNQLSTYTVQDVDM